MHALRAVRLYCDDRCILEYVPEHSSFTLNAEVNPAVVSAVRTALESYPADVFSTQTAVEWKYNATSYSIAPPSLCVGNTCFDGRSLAAIGPDTNALAIALSWHNARSGGLGTALKHTIGRLGETRPTELHFPSIEPFESALNILDRITDVTGETEF
ncbi:hypothetical protein ACNS7O_16570 (plasmid) [Haloferacaceae archaeon DSL9]